MYLIQYIIARFFIFILLLLPEKLRFKFGNFLGSLTYLLIKKRREVAYYNLKMAFPEKTDTEIEIISKKSFKIMIKAFLCTLWFEKYLQNKANMKIVNQESFEKSFSKGRGLVAATMHLGNMEASVIAAGEHEIVTVAKKQRNPYINEYMMKNRSKYIKMEVIEKDKETSRKLMKKIEEKKIIALFSDHRDKGAIVNFFEKEAKAPTGAVSLAIKYDIPLILVYNILNDDNTTSVFVGDEIMLEKTGNFKQDVQRGTQKLIDEIEKVIRKHPEQWMWFHDRWNIHSALKKVKKGNR
ncbi:MAG: lysophospholipid acyltransferase family protein [Fusobacterium sp.]|nr:lysophospholipid acyltransferase family protein [Fusobacterium sp.]